MTHAFDKEYWEHHWDDRTSRTVAANPYLVQETAGSTPGTALDAGCGAGAEAIWLAEQGWRVTGADISATALDAAAKQARSAGVDVTWIEADLTTWNPTHRWDLVTTHYAHPSIPQLDFYRHIAQWVARAVRCSSSAICTTAGIDTHTGTTSSHRTRPLSPRQTSPPCSTPPRGASTPHSNVPERSVARVCTRRRCAMRWFGSRVESDPTFVAVSVGRAKAQRQAIGCTVR